MLRFFISQYPTFGSYTNPIASKIEKSPYYFWWLALTLNSNYIDLCNNPFDIRFKTSKKMLQIYKDFGDVRYEGDKYLAFATWWRGKVSDTDTRGTYLFAEPLRDNRVSYIENVDEAVEAANDESVLLIRIPKVSSRKQIDKSIDRILAREMEFERGRKVRNPSRSKARYKLTSAVKGEHLKQSFDLYELVQNNKSTINNTKLAKMLGIKVSTADNIEKNSSAERRMISTKVSRKKKIATNAINNVIEGLFP